MKTDNLIEILTENKNLPVLFAVDNTDINELDDISLFTVSSYEVDEQNNYNDNTWKEVLVINLKSI